MPADDNHAADVWERILCRKNSIICRICCFLASLAIALLNFRTASPKSHVAPVAALIPPEHLREASAAPHSPAARLPLWERLVALREPLAVEASRSARR